MKQAKVKKVIFIVILISFGFLSFSQYVNPNSSAGVIPLDPLVKVGKLDNGFTYYIRNSTLKNDRALFSFIVKAGHQQDGKKHFQIAHLMEHLAMRGTKNFPNPKSYFASKGIRTHYGAMSANTGDEHTLYSLQDIPATETGLIKDALRFMRDIAHDVVIDTTTIETERGVVKAEFESHQNGDVRVQSQYLNKVIGIPGYEVSTIDDFFRNYDSFKSSDLVDFYEAWYRPEHQGIIIVGDVDLDEMEQLVRSIFADLKPSAIRSEKAKYDPVVCWKNQVLTVASPFLQEVTVKVIMKRAYRPKLANIDYGSFKKTELFDVLLQNRLNVLKRDLPVASVSAYNKNPFNSTRLFSALLTEFRLGKRAGSRDIEGALKTVMIELMRIKKYGFTRQEFDIAKSDLTKRDISQEVSNIHHSIVNGYLGHFVYGEAYLGPEGEKVLQEHLLRAMTFDQINVFAAELIDDKSMDVVILSPENLKAELPSDEIVNVWLREVNNMRLNQYVAKVPVVSGKETVVKPLMTDKELAKFKPAISFQQKTIESIAATEIILPNRMKILLKPLKGNVQEKGMIYIRGISAGGASRYKESDRPAVLISSALVSSSGLGNLSQAELTDLKRLKSIVVNPYISENEEGIVGQAPIEAAELLVQAIYKYFADPKINEKARKELLSRKTYTPDQKSVVKDSILSMMGIEVNKDISYAEIDVELSRAYKFYKQRFMNAGDFTFIVTGDFDVNELASLFAKYLGRLPDTDQREDPPAFAAIPFKNVRSTSTLKTRECYEAAQANLYFAGVHHNTFREVYELKRLQTALKVVLTERLRVVEGKVYHVVVDLNLNKGWYSYCVKFHCSPGQVRNMQAVVMEEVKKLKGQGMKQEFAEQLDKSVLANWAADMTSSLIWLQYLVERLNWQENLEVIAQKDKWNVEFELDRGKALANKFLNENSYIEIFEMPMECK